MCTQPVCGFAEEKKVLRFGAQFGCDSGEAKSQQHSAGAWVYIVEENRSTWMFRLGCGLAEEKSQHVGAQTWL